MSQTRTPARFGRITPADEGRPFKRLAAKASPDEKCALFSVTARRAYRLDVPQ